MLQFQYEFKVKIYEADILSACLKQNQEFSSAVDLLSTC